MTTPCIPWTLRPGQMFYGLLSTGGNEFVWM